LAADTVSSSQRGANSGSAPTENAIIPNRHRARVPFAFFFFALRRRILNKRYRWLPIFARPTNVSVRTRSDTPSTWYTAPVLYCCCVLAFAMWVILSPRAWTIQTMYEIPTGSAKAAHENIRLTGAQNCTEVRDRGVGLEAESSTAHKITVR
jgi:hypothetical protein